MGEREQESLVDQNQLKIEERKIAANNNNDVVKKEKNFFNVI